MAFVGRNGWMRPASGDKGFAEELAKAETVNITSGGKTIVFSAVGFPNAVSKARELCGQV